MKIVVLNGPNLNLLGTREPDIYGCATLADIDLMVFEWGRKEGVKVNTIQSNYEGEIIGAIHEAGKNADGIVINPAAYTHYSFAVYDALKSVYIPAVEVHISNIHAREDFRKNSVTAPASIGIISGFGYRGYIIALNALKDYLERHSE